MSEVHFHQTRMGQRFYESTMPELVRQLTRLNDLLERVVAKIETVMPVLKTPSRQDTNSRN